ncbi:MAG: hypothetical protein J3R72DRAFT_422213 [Linnemannia gamsii]|nr:MAG: hypothetical protein J3R72DRAFT_422213 [Linnemannia gamsii]
MHVKENNTLSTLLRINKYVCSVTLPILYENSFRFRSFQFAYFQSNSAPSNDDILLYLQKLIRTLLLSLPKEGQITDLLRAAYLPLHTMKNRQLSTGPISFPYYSFLTKVDFEEHSHANGGMSHNETLANSTDLTNYLVQGGHAERYLADVNTFQFSNAAKGKFVLSFAARELHRDLTWALKNKKRTL